MDDSPDPLSQLPLRKGFRMRGESMTRLEVFSDAAFAFALTMLVVSVGSIPTTFEELVRALKNVPSFALSFAQISAFWLAHRSWSRKYGLEDGYSTTLTLAMVFVILVYVYPLRLIFSSFFDFVSAGWLPSEFSVTSAEEMAGLFMIYGIGYTALASCIALLFSNALRLRESLQLNPVEALLTKASRAIWTTQACTGLASALFAWLAPTNMAVYAGFVYSTLGGTIPIVSVAYGRKAKAVAGLSK